MTRTAHRPTNPPRHNGNASPDSGAAGELPTLTGREWPTDTRVWSWAVTVVLFGYGPAVSSFARGCRNPLF